MSIATENTKAQMRKGILDFCVLLIISRGKAYASDILQGLRNADLLVVEGTLYPLLNRLKNNNLLTYKWEESKVGPPRKYYILTPQGEKTVRELSKMWKVFSSSINLLISQFS